MAQNSTLGSLELVRKINRSLVLQTVKNSQPISRAQIARKLRLSKTTVIEIVDDLVKRKLIFEFSEKKMSSGGGRPAVMLGFNPKAAYGIGLDIGGTKILAVATDLLGNVVTCDKYPTTGNTEEIKGIICKTINKSGIDESEVISLGIGVPGTINDNKVRLAKNLGWIDFDLIGKLQTSFQFPIFINNDVNLSCVGEQWLGSGNMSNNIFFLSIGTGVGSAILSDGILVNGSDNRAGEICYQTSRADLEKGMKNVVGKFAAFEAKVSGTSLNSHGFDSELLLQDYLTGNVEIDNIVNNFVLDLSIVIANVVSLLNPEYVIIGGGVSESLTNLIPNIQKSVDELTPIKTKIKLATLGEKAGALGAVAFSFSQVEQL